MNRIQKEVIKNIPELCKYGTAKGFICKEEINRFTECFFGKIAQIKSRGNGPDMRYVLEVSELTSDPEMKYRINYLEINTDGLDILGVNKGKPTKLVSNLERQVLTRGDTKFKLLNIRYHLNSKSSYYCFVDIVDTENVIVHIYNIPPETLNDILILVCNKEI